MYYQEMLSFHSKSSSNTKFQGSITSRWALRKRFWVVASLAPIVLASCTYPNAQCQSGSGFASGDSPHVVILLDDSSSMDVLAEEVVQSFNNLLSRLPDSATLSLYGFGDASGVKVLIDNESVATLNPLETYEYIPDGQTPLYDAISFALERNNSSISQGNTKNFSFIIISDGGENASIRYSLGETRSIIQDATSNGINIRFIALGEYAAMEADNLGIDVANTETFDPNAGGVGEAFDNIGGSFNQQSNGQNCDQLFP